MQHLKNPPSVHSHHNLFRPGPRPHYFSLVMKVPGNTDESISFSETPGVGDGQEGLACCNSWGRKE